MMHNNMYTGGAGSPDAAGHVLSESATASMSQVSNRKREGASQAAVRDPEEKKVRLSLYGRALRKFPLIVNGLQAAFLSATSQLLSQSLKGTAPANFDYTPTAQFALISAFVVTPVSTVFFNIVGRFQLKTPASLTLDFFVGGPVLNCAFIAALKLLEGGGSDDVVEVLMSRGFWVDMVLGSNKVWLRATQGCFNV